MMAVKAVNFGSAHMIRAGKTHNSRAVCALDGIHRWCITGTPLQNRLGDLSSLLRFLKVYPYDDPKTFEAEIMQPWRRTINEKPLHKLQLLMKAIALRRSKSVVSLPARDEHIKEVAFSDEEMDLYKRAREGTIQILDKALLSGTATGSIYLNAFQRINELRFICNHGLRHRDRSTQSARGRQEVDDKSQIQELEHILDNSDQACLICGTDIEDIEEECESSRQYLEYSDAEQSESLRLCRQCLQERTKVSSSSLPIPSPSERDITEDDESKVVFPSKIKAAVSHLQDVPAEDKWYVDPLNIAARLSPRVLQVLMNQSAIFSYWTSTLDIMQQALRAAGVSYCRYDGRLSYAKRTEVLQKFNADPSVRAILVSITCGGQG